MVKWRTQYTVQTKNRMCAILCIFNAKKVFNNKVKLKASIKISLYVI